MSGDRYLLAPTHVSRKIDALKAAVVDLSDAQRLTLLKWFMAGVEANGNLRASSAVDVDSAVQRAKASLADMSPRDRAYAYAWLKRWVSADDGDLNVPKRGNPTAIRPSNVDWSKKQSE